MLRSSSRQLVERNTSTLTETTGSVNLTTSLLIQRQYMIRMLRCDPLFEFGQGLSYTAFEHFGLEVGGSAKNRTDEGAKWKKGEAVYPPDCRCLC